jgi:hypothetical protein
MPNSDYLISEEQIREEDLLPVEQTKPQTPSGPAGTAPPSAPVYDITRQFFSGSLPPQFQLDANFARARAASTRVPESALMPFGIQSNPSTNAAITSTTKTVIQTLPPSPSPSSNDDDSIIVNLQTGPVYTVQQSDFNKLISISNAAADTIFLPPVSGSVGVSVNNKSGVAPFLFNAGNTTINGQSALSVATVTVAGSPINKGDILFCFVRLHSNQTVTAQLQDGVFGPWTIVAQANTPTTDHSILFSVRANTTLSVGSTFTISLGATYVGTVFTPGENILWNMTGLKNISGAISATGNIVGNAFSSGGLTNSVPETTISCGETNDGSLTTGIPSGPWTNISTMGGNVASVNYRTNVLGLVNDVYATNASTGVFDDLLVSYVQLAANDIVPLSGNFFCYVQNTGATGTFTLKSDLPIDGSTTVPVTIGPGQGMLLVYNPSLNGWFTERGEGGGSVTIFYQTVQQAGTSKPQENKLNFLAPVTATDNGGNGSTDIAVPVMVGDSGAGGTAGLVPAPGAGDAAAGKFLKASGAFATPPTMVGDSGSGGTAGYAPAPGAGDNAAGKFLSAGGTYVNPGSNPASFNTGLVYAIASGYALG